MALASRQGLMVVLSGAGGCLDQIEPRLPTRDTWPDTCRGSQLCPISPRLVVDKWRVGGEAGEAIFYIWFCLLLSSSLCVTCVWWSPGAPVSAMDSRARDAWVSCHNSPHFNWNMWRCDIKCEPGTRATWHGDITIIRMTDDRCHHDTSDTRWSRPVAVINRDCIDFSFYQGCKIWMHL